MLGESVFTDGLLQDQRVFFNALKLQIVESLLAAYPRHSSSNVLKGFSIRFTMHEGYFAVTAIAELGLPTSLSEGFDIVLEDNFMGAYSTNGFFDALEHLGEQVEHYLDEEEKNDTWGMETRISGEEYFSGKRSPSMTKRVTETGSEVRMVLWQDIPLVSRVWTIGG